jgi:hypothetical protein
MSNPPNPNPIHYPTLAADLLYEWWYTIAERLFERVCEVTELDDEQRDALRAAMLRPNDYHVETED